MRAKFFRILINFWPCIRGTGGRVTHLSEDYRDLEVRLPLNWRTRNRVGTIFGGSLYASIDPFYMLMLMEIFGPKFVVWDKGASIRFKRPGTETVFAKLHLSKEFTDEIKQIVLEKGEHSFDIPLSYRDKSGNEVAEIQKTLYVATKSYYREKIARRKSSTVNSPSLSKS
jgi:acyl-coenzyme A thioesterase PaaI-like protein